MLTKVSKLIKRKTLSSIVNKNAPKRQFSNGVYLWIPKLDGRLTGIATQTTTMNNSLSKGIPKRIEQFDELNVQKLRIGVRHSAVISDEGMLYTTGYGNWGVLGHGNEKNIRYYDPKLVTKFEKEGLKVVDVALGDYHTLALTDDGNVWTWGYAGKQSMFSWMVTQQVGALGHGNFDPHFEPKRVEYFAENNIKIKEISSGLYSCNALTEDGQLYTWGRGLYGVLGNGSNQHSYVPILNESVEQIKLENIENGTDEAVNHIAQFDSVNDFSIMRMQDGTLNAWGKNDTGQMGVTPGIGIDMVESENVPTMINLKDEEGNPQNAKDFGIGQYTMIIQDTENDLYISGLRLNYEPKKLQFDPHVLDKSNVKMIASGKRSYCICTNDNQLLIWGNVIKLDKEDEQSDYQTDSEGFLKYNGSRLFEEQDIKHLEIKNNVFGALVSE